MDYLIYNAGLWYCDNLEDVHLDNHREMYEANALGPLKVASALLNNGNLQRDSKIVLVSSQDGSIGLRTETEEGGDYGHHMSKAAENMLGRILSFDLKPKGIHVMTIHPGFLKTEMTKKFRHLYSELGAIDPEDAVEPFYKAICELSAQTTGRFVAPLGRKSLGFGSRGYQQDVGSKGYQQDVGSRGYQQDLGSRDYQQDVGSRDYQQEFGSSRDYQKELGSSGFPHQQKGEGSQYEGLRQEELLELPW